MYLKVNKDYLDHKLANKFNLNLKGRDFKSDLKSTNRNVKQSSKGKTQIQLSESLDQHQKHHKKFNVGVDSIKIIG